MFVYTKHMINERLIGQLDLSVSMRTACLSALFACLSLWPQLLASIYSTWSLGNRHLWVDFNRV